MPWLHAMRARRHLRVTDDHLSSGQRRERQAGYRIACLTLPSTSATLVVAKEKNFHFSFCSLGTHTHTRARMRLASQGSLQSKKYEPWKSAFSRPVQQGLKARCFIITKAVGKQKKSTFYVGDCYNAGARHRSLLSLVNVGRSLLNHGEVERATTSYWPWASLGRHADALVRSTKAVCKPMLCKARLLVTWLA
jgi:hypothetical protein